MAVNYTLTAATQTLTVSDNFDNGETCVIGGKTYTFQDTLTNSDGNVHIGSDTTGDMQNLLAAINLTDGGESSTSAGTDYAAAMTIHPDVKATAVTATTLVITCKTPGTAGNFINTTETGNEHAWGAATMAGGAGDVTGWAESLISLSQINSEVLSDLHAITVTVD